MFVGAKRCGIWGGLYGLGEDGSQASSSRRGVGVDGKEREAGPLLKEEAGEKGSQALRKWFQQLRMKERRQEVFAPRVPPPGPGVSCHLGSAPSLLQPMACLLDPMCQPGTWWATSSWSLWPHSSPSAPGDPTAHPRPGGVSGVSRAQVPGGPASQASSPSSSAPHLTLPDPEGCFATP